MFKKIKNFVSGNILFIETLVILAFIPLYPKLPLVDVKNTWVYIRVEDFLVVFVLLSWLALLIRKKVTLKTPLTIPLLIFWLIGAIATTHGVLLIFPMLTDVFPNVAFLTFVRHIEYMSVFFIAYQGMRDKGFLKYVIATLIATFLGVTLYGFGQKFENLPAYLTMNEEFAKGVPIHLSSLSRISSTFAGHYDLAAYIVLMIPIFVSLIFGVKNWLIKTFLAFTSVIGLILLFMTVSRVSFLVLFAAVAVVLFFQKRRLILISIPLILVAGFLFVAIHPSSLLNRFKSTASYVDVVVDAQTGEALGHVKFVNRDYFKDKLVLQRRVKDKLELANVIAGQDAQSYSTSSAILPFKYIFDQSPLVTAINISTGENLPQGTEYVNLVLSPVVKRIESFYYELPPDFKSSPSAQVLVLRGDFVVKRATAYDLSLTTRTQGEWPRALDAFKRNIFIGSGYDSVTLAVDNNYLRMLAEIGLLGFIAFFLLFFILGAYIKNVYSDIDSPVARAFVLGFGAGVIGLALNATLIDVFEASKIAFILWALFGVTFGLLSLYKKKEVDIAAEIKKAATSKYAIVLYLLLTCVVLLSPTIDNFFVGDDFSWLRWVADCKDKCDPLSRIISYFTNSDGFFYRPGTKLYFYIMYSRFWLNQTVYHVVSLSLHFLVALSFFFLAKKIIKDKLLAFLSSITFLLMSGSTEAILWISSVGYLFNALFGVLSLLSFIQWDEKKKSVYLLASVIFVSLSLLFHEMGVIYPILIIAYFVINSSNKPNLRGFFKRKDYISLLIPVIGYFIMRFLAHSHWSGGDYNYNLVKLPFNFVGNALGYASIVLTGPVSMGIYDKLRNLTKAHLLITLVLVPIMLLSVTIVYKIFRRYFDLKEKKVVLFGLSFFFITLLPFLGLGNITSRYSYVASFGLILVLVTILKKIYKQLLGQGKEIAMGVVAVLVSVFILFHIIQVQQSYFEWQEAGNRVERFFISFQAEYKDYWLGKDAEFHFVNVPTKIGGAWIFPVGLDHAVWFSIQNPNAKVIIDKDLDTALKEAGYYRSRTVFVFNDDGSVHMIDRLLTVPANLIIPPK